VESEWDLKWSKTLFECVQKGEAGFAGVYTTKKRSAIKSKGQILLGITKSPMRRELEKVGEELEKVREELKKEEQPEKVRRRVRKVGGGARKGRGRS
jgi:hemerythrin-like domain-containing protein